MNKIILFLILSLSYSLSAQSLPSDPMNGFAFPFGTKFIIKLHPVDSVNFDYSVIAFEEFSEEVDTWDYPFFSKNLENNGTIEFYFCLSTTGKTEKEKKRNRKVILVMKNRTDYNLKYNSDIQLEVDGQFVKTSNVGTFSGAKGTEIWSDRIYQIALSEFRIMKF